MRLHLSNLSLWAQIQLERIEQDLEKTGIRIFRLKHGLSRQTYNIRLGWKRNRMKNHKSQFGVESGPFLPNIEGSGLCFQPTLEYNYEWCSQGFNLRLRNEFFLLIQKSGTFNLIFRIAHFFNTKYHSFPFPRFLKGILYLIGIRDKDQSISHEYP